MSSSAGARSRALRRFVPSTVVLSRIRPLVWILDLIDRATSLPFPELRGLPPNRFRIRVGVGNRLLFNQVLHLSFGTDQVFTMVALGVIDSRSRIVEIGAGCGRFATALQRAGSFEGSYLGVDVDGEMIDWCRGHMTSDRFRFEHADIRNRLYNPRGGGAVSEYALPSGDAEQDAVIGLSLATHLLTEDLSHYLRESARILRPGGALCLSAFCIEHMEELGLLGDRWTMKHRIGEAFVESLKHPEAAVGYRRETLERMGREAGFSEVELLYPRGSLGVQSLLVCRL